MKKNIKLKTLALCLAMVIVLTGLITANAFEVIGGCTCGGVYDNGFCDTCDGYQPAEQNADGYYEIGNAGQLYWFAAYVNAGNTTTNAVLTDDITINENLLDEDGNLNEGEFLNWTPIDNYYGTFDGQNHVVIGLYCNFPDSYSIGLFGHINSSAEVRNLGVKDGCFYGKSTVGGVVCSSNGTVTNCYNAGIMNITSTDDDGDVGGVVGYNGGTVTDCYNAGTINGAVGADGYVGGVVGVNYCGNVKNCYNSGTVNGNDRVAGVVSNMQSGLMENCYNSGTVTASTDDARAGGVVADQYDGIVSNCYNKGEVTSSGYAGGVAAWNDATVTNCYNAGTVTSEGNFNNGYPGTGGVVGWNAGTVAKCYNSGAVGGEQYVGGVAGYCDFNGTITNCYNTGDVSGDSYVGGVAGGVGNDSVVTNCYSVGSVSGDEYIAGVVAYGRVNNCYYLEDVAAGDGGNSEAKPEADFASGMVALLLGPAYGQTVGQDSYPVFRTATNEVYGYGTCTAPVLNDNPNNPNPGDQIVHQYNDGVNDEADNGFCTCFIAPYQKPTVNDAGYYEISNGGQLYWFAEFVNLGNADADAKLTKDIVVNENVLVDGVLNTDSTVVENFRPWTPTGRPGYTGEFDGQNFTISGLHVEEQLGHYVSLFSRISAGAEVKNLGVADSYFCGYWYVGSVVGYNNGTVQNCCNNGAVSGDRQVGGVVGQNNGAVMSCSNDGKVDGGDFYVGGVVGVSYGTVTNCYNTGAVSGTNYRVGGVVGCNDGNVTQCHNSGTVSGNDSVAGVVGDNNYGTVTNCYNVGDITGKSDVGGVIGFNGGGTMTNCYNTGAVRGDSNVGGVAGWHTWSATMTNCYSVGSVSGGEYVGGVVGVNPSGAVKNCYYLEGTVTNGNSYGTVKTEAQFKSGEVTYLLNGDQSEIVFGQLIGTDDYPVFFDGENQVFAVALCPGKSGYSNVYQTEIPPHNYDENDICTICGAEKTPDLVDGYYILMTVEDLYWFADYVNSGNTGANAKLGANIVVNTDVLDANGYNNSGDFRSWTPIGNSFETYTGTFDGQNYTISGLYCNNGGSYIGLFGYIGSGAVIKNLGVLDSYFYGSEKVGGVVGYNYYGTIQLCYTASYVCGGYDAGGIAGYNYGTVENCYSHSRVYGDDDAGGIVGENQGPVRNCYSMGSISCSSNYYGGIAGYGSGSVTNCYYLEGSAGYGSNYGYRYGTEEIRETFASGEVAFLLGNAYGQLLGADDYPVFRTEANTLYPCALCPNKTDGYSNDPDHGRRRPG